MKTLPLGRRDGHGRVERATGYSADSHGASCHDEADRQSVERVAGVILAGGDIQHDVAQREGDKQLRDRRRDDSVKTFGFLRA